MPDKTAAKNHAPVRGWAALCAGCLLFFHALPAWAVQAHGEPEGLVVHEIGHLLFIAGLLFLLAKIHQNRFTGIGWQEFREFLWLMVAWNVLTFGNHWMHEAVDPHKFIRLNGHIVSFHATSILDYIHYFSHLDHLILVPAFIFLFRALCKWEKAA